MGLLHFVSELPLDLQQHARYCLDHIEDERVLAALSEQFQRSLVLALSRSPFVSDVLRQQPALISEWQSPSSRLFQGSDEEDMRCRLSEQCARCSSEEELMAALRQFRNAEQARIIWRDMNGLTNLDGTLTEASALADVCIQVALDWLNVRLKEKYGTPRSRSGHEQNLIVLGMGKLGARELNVSSDIDLIFAFPNAGQTDSPKKCIDNQQYFTKLGQRLIHVLDHRTVDGFVHRVDMRLRPYGGSGALALNFASFEDYFQTQGREWERFAMLKARPITGDRKDRNYLIQNIIRPFVYRRYPDYSSFEALREMKRLIKSEVLRKGGDQNIKLGSGGIREIEFIAQATQLIYGGRDARLQDTGLQSVFKTLVSEEYLPHDWVATLLEAYRYLRDLEHAIQGYEDQQTQLLPTDVAPQIAVSQAMSEDSWDELVEKSVSLRQGVSSIFDAFLYEDSEASAQEASTSYHWLALWKDHDSSLEAWREEFERAGFDDPSASASAILELRELPRFGSISASARDRFEAFLPRLLTVLGDESASAQTLARVLTVVQAVLGRTIYLVLLNENDEALKQLCKLCSESQWFADHIAASPIVLDDLLHPETLYHPPVREELSDELRQSLLRIPEDDLEAQMDCLRNFKQSHMLRVAAAEISAVLPVMKVSDYLTWLAEACVEAALGIAWRNLVQKHGLPELRSIDGEAPETGAVDCAGFAVVGYGKLGGIELGYSSDLDMVFLYDANDFGTTCGEKPVNNQLFYTRLGQRLMHILGAQTSQGVCYEVDMRLRPSGNSGMLVSSVAAFERYQKNDAWTWEHQAIVRARFITGDPSLQTLFEDVRKAVLCARRDKSGLKAEVRKMREKMRIAEAEKLKSQALAEASLKQGHGGLVDVEFITQYLILAYAHDFPALVQWTDNVRLLDCLAERLDYPVDFSGLIDAYRKLRSALHRKSLSGKDTSEGLDHFESERALVQQSFAELFKE